MFIPELIVGKHPEQDEPNTSLAVSSFVMRTALHYSISFCFLIKRGSLGNETACLPGHNDY